MQISESDLHAWLQCFLRGVRLCVRFLGAEAQAVNANGFPAPEHEFGMVNPLGKSQHNDWQDQCHLSFTTLRAH